jgi:hypothetical protein
MSTTDITIIIVSNIFYIGVVGLSLAFLRKGEQR